MESKNPWVEKKKKLEKQGFHQTVQFVVIKN